MKPTFDPIYHRYSTGDRVVPSVTEILRAVSLYGSFQFAEDVHRWRGTAVHQFCAIADFGGTPVLGAVAPQFKQVADDIVNGYGAAFMRFKERTKWQGRIWEMPAVHGLLGYGGCFDSVGEMGDDVVLLDLKSGSMPSLVPAQLAMYWLLITEGTPVDEEHPGLDWLREVVKSGRPVKRMALQLSKDGKDTLFSETSKGDSFSSPVWLSVARSAINLYNIRAKYGTLDKEPR